MPSLETFVTKAASAAGMTLCRYRGTALLDGLERVVDRFHRRLNNVDFEMHRNGEARVLDVIARLQPHCVFDVGANLGDWTAAAAARMGSCTIHAFEIVPDTFEQLKRRLGGMRTAQLNACGLSDTGEPVTIHLGPQSDTATACRIAGLPFHEQYYRGQIRCVTTTAAQYMRERGVEHVDFVKIDVEGMDLRVIKGFGSRLRDVRALQFEYGIFNIASHDLLGDFYRHLHEHGFVVGKIFPKRVAFGDYHFNMENFHGSNYLAVREDEARLIRLLAGARGR